MASLTAGPRKRLKQSHGEPLHSYDRTGDDTSLIGEQDNDWSGGFPWTYESNTSFNSQTWSNGEGFNGISSPGSALIPEVASPSWSSPCQYAYSSPTFDQQLFVKSVMTEASRLQHSVRNPFLDNSDNHLPAELSTTTTLTPKAGINSYIKLPAGSIKSRDGDTVETTRSTPALSHENRIRYTGIALSKTSPIASVVYRLPKYLGQAWNMDSVEVKLMQFYIIGFCSGRTLLIRTNSWQKDVAPMVSDSELVRSTLLALACTYVHEYFPSEKLRRRANYYYWKGTKLLGRALANPDADKADCVVSAIAVFNMHDVVLHERRRPKSQTPRWLEGALLGSDLLDNSDPACRYNNPSNVQVNAAWVSNATLIARAAIFAQPLTGLDESKTANKFLWLLHGDKHEERRIHGASGLSPKLLHMWNQATHLCARLEKDPTSISHQFIAKTLLDRLENFHQWSELSEGHASLSALLEACPVGSASTDNSAARITDIGAQAWVAALKVYLHCRFYRLPRHNMHVLLAMSQLQQCVERMPTTGTLFTAQIPLLPIFMLGLLSVEPGHRQTATRWFENVLETSNCRSSVIPLWPALRRIWSWIDKVAGDSAGDAARPVGDRNAWWERMVKEVEDTEGTLCLI